MRDKIDLVNQNSIRESDLLNSLIDSVVRLNLVEMLPDVLAVNEAKNAVDPEAITDITAMKIKFP